MDSRLSDVQHGLVRVGKDFRIVAVGAEGARYLIRPTEHGHWHGELIASANQDRQVEWFQNAPISLQVNRANGGRFHPRSSPENAAQTGLVAFRVENEGGSIKYLHFPCTGAEYFSVMNDPKGLLDPVEAILSFDGLETFPI